MRLLMPSGTNRNRCCASFENATSHTEPEARDAWAELRKACAEQYELAGLAALKPTSFTYAFTKMEEAGWLREGRSASRFILSEPGCRHLGVEYVGPMDWDEES